jgi:hypothetical protein
MAVACLSEHQDSPAENWQEVVSNYDKWHSYSWQLAYLLMAIAMFALWEGLAEDWTRQINFDKCHGYSWQLAYCLEESLTHLPFKTLPGHAESAKIKIRALLHIVDANLPISM